MSTEHDNLDELPDICNFMPSEPWTLSEIVRSVRQLKDDGDLTILYTWLQLYRIQREEQVRKK